MKYQNVNVSGVGHAREAGVDFIIYYMLGEGLTIKPMQVIAGGYVGAEFLFGETGIGKLEWEDLWTGLHPTVEIDEEKYQAVPSHNVRFLTEVLESHGFEDYEKIQRPGVPHDYMMRDSGDQKFF